MSSPASPVPTPLEVSARAFDALNEHDLHQLRSLMADDVVQHIVPVGVHDGLEAVLAYYEEVFAAAPDLRIDVTDVAADGEVVLVAWELAATFTGAPFQGLRPNASRVRLEGASTHVVREGRVGQRRWDRAGGTAHNRSPPQPTRTGNSLPDHSPTHKSPGQAGAVHAEDNDVRCDQRPADAPGNTTH